VKGTRTAGEVQAESRRCRRVVPAFRPGARAARGV